MIVVDSDHLTVLAFHQHSLRPSLRSRMDESGEPFVTTVACAEEQMRGWLSAIHSAKDVHDQIAPYERLAMLFRFFGPWTLLPFDTRAADEFIRLRKQRIRIGTMDLKIAAITLTHDALLLSANLQDYRKVPGLRVENWLKE